MNNFLKDLPCINRENFQNLEYGRGTEAARYGRHSNSVKRPTVFIQTKDYPEEQVLITTEKTNILLRYLQQQLDKKNKKRDMSRDDSEETPRKHRKIGGDT